MFARKNLRGGASATPFTKQVFFEKGIPILTKASEIAKYPRDKPMVKIGETPYWVLCTSNGRRAYETIMPMRGYFGGKEILEIGCSGGLSTKEIAEMLPESRITAIDVRPDAIRVAKKECAGLIRQGKAEFLNADGYRLKECFGNRLFDAILALNNVLALISEFSDRELEMVMRNFTDRLKVGGALFLSLEDAFLLYVKSESGMKWERWAINSRCTKDYMGRACNAIEKK